MDLNVFLLLLLSATFGISSSALQQFYYVNVKKSWLEAQSYCRATYIDLATVGSMEDMNRLKAAVDPAYTGAVWIGLKKHWVLSTGENISAYNNWVPGQPNEGNVEAACGVQTPQGWHDFFCSTMLYCVCFDDRSDPSGTFILIRSNMTWTQAQTYCSQHYTNLASVHNAQEQQQVFTVVGNNTSAWIGLISGQWSDKGFSPFRYWANGQAPESTSTEKCAAMMMSNSGKWTQSQCDLQNPFICYGGLQPLFRLYHFVNDPKTWTKAQTYCRNRFTDLATVDSVKDMSSLMKAVDLGYSGSLWIGLKQATQPRWGWSRGDELLSNFSNWDAGRPNGTGQCVFTADEVWRDYDCTVALYFVCYKEGTGYILVETSKNWYDAQSYCRTSYTDLASIRSPWEQKQVTDLVVKGGSVWVGLFLDTWQWSDQWSLSFRNWASGQPSSGTGSCSAVVMGDSGKWIADDCNVQHPFICYGEEDRMKKKQIMKVTVSSNGKADVNEPFVRAALLNEIEKQLERQGMANGTKLSWRLGNNGKVFTLKPER
ncbi:macrophage mannose receptor 1-like [Colossoma macropomum]|uniref:macrophage mannose receptor 1-like n=1 Tax=Colossoma macropomum TaxID=42526 RepID=UPI00186518EC|nr:macrophage mannose receptor 1-like [Colossoma macropomum]